MTEREIQTKAGVWRMVGELGHEEAHRRLSASPCSAFPLDMAVETPTERMSAHTDNEGSEAAVDVPRLVRRWRDASYKFRCEWRLYWNLCPSCNSDAPRCDRCGTCHGSREFPLKPETKDRYRHSFHNDYDRA